MNRAMHAPPGRAMPIAMVATNGLAGGAHAPLVGRSLWVAVQRFWQRLWGAQMNRAQVDLAVELDPLRGQEGGDDRPGRHMARLFVGLLGGLQALAMKGQVRMEDDPQVLQRLCEHVRELGLMAGTQHLPVSRWQRWMEDRVLLQGLMTGVLGDLSLALPPGGVDYLRRPLLHMALLEHLCTLAWSNGRLWNGRITVRTLNGELIYHMVMNLESDTALRHVARSVWELEKMLLVAGESRNPRMEVGRGALQLTVTLDP
jgi:hypothetical protein